MFGEPLLVGGGAFGFLLESDQRDFGDHVLWLRLCLADPDVGLDCHREQPYKWLVDMNPHRTLMSTKGLFIQSHTQVFPCLTSQNPNVIP